MYVLLITNKEDVTTDYVVRELISNLIPFYRLNTEAIGDYVQVRFDMEKENYQIYDAQLNRSINLSEVTSVYFRRPELKDDLGSVTDGERRFLTGELITVLESLYILLANAKWLNPLDAMRKAENKPYQLLLAKELGFKIPAAVITNHIHTVTDFYNRHNENCIIKALRTPLIDEKEGESVIFTSRFQLDNNHLERIELCPMYLQEHIVKKGDLRVTVVGDTTYSAFIHSQGNEESTLDWRKSSQPPAHEVHQLPKAVAERCINYVKRLGLQFGAIDLILDQDGEYVFVEINPNGQWAWIERQLNLPISKSITELLC